MTLTSLLPSPTRSGGRAAERAGLLRAFAVFGLFWGAWVACLPAVRQSVSAGDGELGLALGAVAIAALPMMPVAGRLADRHGAHRLLPLCLLAFAAVLWLPGLARSLPALVAGLVALGAATGAFDVVVNTATAAWERSEQDRLMSLGHGAFSAGVLVGSTGAGLARQAGSGQLPILAVVAVLVALVGLTQPAYRRPQDEPARRSGPRLPAALIGLAVLIAGAFLCEDALQSWSSLQLERGLGAGPALSGLGPGIFAGTMAVGRLAGGALGARLRDGVLFGLSACALAAGALLLALAGSPAVALVGLTVAGAGTSLLAPVLFSAVGRRAAPGRQGADLSAVTALGYAGFVTGPAVIGFVSAATSLPTALAALGGIGLLLAVAGPLALRERGAGPAAV